MDCHGTTPILLLNSMPVDRYNSLEHVLSSTSTEDKCVSLHLTMLYDGVLTPQYTPLQIINPKTGIVS
jgi:hypothetical protein